MEMIQKSLIEHGGSYLMMTLKMFECRWKTELAKNKFCGLLYYQFMDEVPQLDFRRYF